MKLGDLIVFLPGAFIATVAKTIKTKIPEQTKDYIEQNHLYHCTLQKETAEKIIKSGYIKPATGITKNISSYGKAACFMFAGMPNMDSFIKNMSVNPYLEPDRIIHTIEIDVNKEELNNYKVRPLADEAVLYEGYCVLPNNRAKIVEMVADLTRDEEGNPIIDSNTGKPKGIEFRKRTQKEMEESPDKYIPKEDYIKYVNEQKKEFGFIQEDGKISNIYNNLSNVMAGGKLEYNEVIRSTKKNFLTVIKNFTKRLKNKSNMLDENTDIKIENIIKGKNFLNRKNPYADRKFATAISEFQKQGLIQYNLKEVLPEFVNSKNGVFLRDKVRQLDKSPIRKKGMHGIKHNDRVAMLSLIIANGENIIKEDSTREREILTSAAYYHDIGRISDIGPHAGRSARLIKKLNLKYLDGKIFSEEDKRIVQFLARGHEGNDNNISKLIKKYKINSEDIEMSTNLLKVLKDADALDRSRLTINTPINTITDLEPKYLRLDTSRRLMEASYGLEALSTKVKIEDIQNYKNRNQKEHYYNKTTLRDEIRVDDKVKEVSDKNKQKDIQNIKETNHVDNEKGENLEL